VPGFALPAPAYRPPVLSGLTYTGLPRAFSSLPAPLPTARGPFPVFPAAPRTIPAPFVPRPPVPLSPLPSASAYQSVVSGGGFWSGLAKVTAGTAIATGLMLGGPEAVAGKIAWSAGISAGGYVASHVWHNMTHPPPGPAYPIPQLDMHGHLEPPPPLPPRLR
jgi:hypothetical protein